MCFILETYFLVYLALHKSLLYDMKWCIVGLREVTMASRQSSLLVLNDIVMNVDRF